MIKGIIDLLMIDEHYGVSETVEIAKGKYQVSFTWKDVWYKIKRHTWQTKR